MSELEALEDWVAGLMTQLQPREQKKLTIAIGRAVRRQQVDRIRANVDPDGNKMQPRKTKRKIRGKSGRIRRSGRMFPNIAKARNLRIKASTDRVEIGFPNPAIARSADIHHHGKVGYVGKTPDGKTIRTKYVSRRLLGLPPEDRELIMDAAIEHLDAGLI